MNHPILTALQSCSIIFIGKFQTSSTFLVLSKSEISQTHKDNLSSLKVDKKKKECKNEEKKNKTSHLFSFSSLFTFGVWAQRRFIE